MRKGSSTFDDSTSLEGKFGIHGASCAGDDELGIQDILMKHFEPLIRSRKPQAMGMAEGKESGVSASWQN
jgi:hypothetical protein